MKKILAAMVMATIATTSHASAIDKRLREAKLERQIAREDAAASAVPSPIEERTSSVRWHPTSVAIGAIVGGAFFGGVGAVVVGGAVGEVAARVIKKKQEKTAAEESKETL